jgi:hypothetical protein
VSVRLPRGVLIAVAVLDIGAVLAAQPLYPPGTWDLSAGVLYAATITSFSGVGAFLAVRVPANPIGWLLVAAGTLLAVGIFGGAYAMASVAASGGTWPATALLAWLTDVSFIPPIVIVAAGVPAVFPDGRLPSSRWRWLPIVLVSGTIAAIAEPAFTPGPINDAMPVDNPFGVPALVPYVELANAISTVTAAPAFVGGVAAVATRFRRGTVVERQQVKWLLAVAAVAAIAFPFAFVLPAGIPSTIAWYVGFGSLIGLPVAIGIAIRRYRLYEIDRIVSRTLAWAIVTAVVGAVFVGGVLVLEAVLGDVTQGQTLAVAASTLVAFALFQPLRRRIQALVDRRFDRARVDGDRMAAAFAEHLRDQVEVDSVALQLDATVRTAVLPRTTAVWLRSRNDFRTKEA